MKFSIDTSHPKAKELIKMLESLDYVQVDNSYSVNEPAAPYVSSKKNNEVNFDSYALPGPPISTEEFREHIRKAEEGPSIPFDDWKKEWEAKKIDLLKNIG